MAAVSNEERTQGFMTSRDADRVCGSKASSRQCIIVLSILFVIALTVAVVIVVKERKGVPSSSQFWQVILQILQL